MSKWQEKCLECGGIFEIYTEFLGSLISCPYCRSWTTQEVKDYKKKIEGRD